MEFIGRHYRAGLGPWVSRSRSRQVLTTSTVWLPYVEVPRIDEAAEHARRAGATVRLGPREGPAGRRSLVSVPDGAEIAFWELKAAPAGSSPPERR